MTPIRRALLSVSDKTGLIDFAKGLAAQGVMARLPMHGWPMACRTSYSTAA